MEVDDNEYAEFLAIRTEQAIERRRKSEQSVTDLEDDIDEPIRSCVAKLALLGLEPRWSCCGFDYIGQPPHKSHQYGAAWVVLNYNQRCTWLFEHAIDIRFNDYINGWRTNLYRHYDRNYVSLRSELTNGNAWPDPDSTHYYESGSIAIAYLDEFLSSHQDEFFEIATVTDTNAEFMNLYPTWQYSPKLPWVIQASDYKK